MPSENITSPYCNHLAIIPNLLTELNCVATSTEKNIYIKWGTVWDIRERIEKAIYRFSRAPHNLEFGHFK